MGSILGMSCWDGKVVGGLDIMLAADSIWQLSAGLDSSTGRCGKMQNATGFGMSLCEPCVLNTPSM